MLGVFVRVLSQIGQRVVWKWEQADTERPLHNFPNNFLLADWIPQQDLLGHPNARLMITAGGLCTVQEAVYHAVPILGMPFHEEQRLNLARARKGGYALRIDWKSLSDENLRAAVTKLINDPR